MERVRERDAMYQQATAAGRPVHDGGPARGQASGRRTAVESHAKASIHVRPPIAAATISPP